MSGIGSKRKIALASAIGGFALLGGGLFVSGALVSAQEPTPAPGTEQQAPKSKEECERDKQGTGDTGADTTGSGVRGRSTESNARDF